MAPIMTAGAPPCLILGVDTAIGLTMVRELGQHGVPVIGIGRSASAIGGASRWCQRLLLRDGNRPIDEWLPEMIRQTGAKAVMASSEGDLLALADMPAMIDGCQILTPRRGPLDAVLDKVTTLDAARTLGLDVPASWRPSAGEDFAARAAQLEYPVILKWPHPPRKWPILEAAGLPFIKAEHITNAPDLLLALSRYDSIGIWPLVQGWCGGYGLGQMLLMHEGRATLRFQHRRLREYPAMGGVSTLCTSIPSEQHQAQMLHSEQLLAAIGWEGPAMVEYRHDPTTGRYWLMEVNGRFWGSLPLASQAGAAFVWGHYRQSMLGEEPSPAEQRYRPLRARYLGPDIKRLRRVLQDPVGSAGIGHPPFKRMRELMTFATDFFRFDTSYYVGSLRDPGPLLRDLSTMFLSLLKKA
jgi:predicted ATP-grasp superfamily ATP-dependent carboligase